MSEILTKNRPDITTTTKPHDLEQNKDTDTIVNDAHKLREQLEVKAKLYEKLVKNGAAEAKVHERIQRALHDLDTILGLCGEESA